MEVLLLHRHHEHSDVAAGITAALTVGALSPDVVAVETRKHQQHQADSASAAGDPVVVSLAERRLSELTDHLPTDSRPLPTVTAYDSLLTGTRDA